MVSTTVTLVALIALGGYLLARTRAGALAGSGDVRLHSLPGYHGVFVALWVGLPSLLLVLVWLALQGPVIDALLVESLPETLRSGGDGGRIDLLLSEIKSVASGRIFGEPEPAVLAAAERYAAWREIARWAMVAAATCVALLGLALAQRRLSPAFRARESVERITTGLMIACAVLAIV
ncbi:MAG TPA: phosphate ABC transporter permease family protein, partial [Kiloniellales bacterium]|nr:phosphate ABC transporter permease family protein [Kiloniellales bacterium]